MVTCNILLQVVDVPEWNPSSIYRVQNIDLKADSFGVWIKFLHKLKIAVSRDCPLKKYIFHLPFF